jgi:hypothetical protein
MALERSLSQAAALRNRYALSIGPLAPDALPGELQPYYLPFLRVELRTLYEEGRESRRQYLFVDSADRSRLIAVLTEAGEEERPVEGEGPEEARGSRGYIEEYDDGGAITGARQFMGDGSEYLTAYAYRQGFLIRAETRYISPPEPPEEELAAEELTAEAPPQAAGPEEAGGEDRGELEPPETASPGEGRLVSTDHYRYTRTGSLRLVERVFNRKAGEEDEASRFRFPPLSPRAPVNQDFVHPTVAYSSEFLEDVILSDASRVLYATDDRGRILTETRQDENGQTLGEIRNTWSGDRLLRVEWDSPQDQRRTEYDYDQEGERIEERNYAGDELERVVRREGNREVEELYMNGVPILRALWEEGRKISEERLRSPPSGGGRTR